MIGLDTNVLVRILVADDDAQTRAAAQLLLSLNDRPQSVFVPDIVLVESVWALSRIYKIGKADILMTLDWIMSMPVFIFQNRAVLKTAIETYRQGPADFADYLIVGTNTHAGCSRTLTFDAKLSRHAGAQRLPTA